MRYLNTVYVREHRARISKSKGSLIVSTPDGKQRIPLRGIDGLVLAGGGQVTTDAIAACVQHGVRVASLKRSGAVRFTVSPPISGNVHLRTAQVLAAENEQHALDVARSIVAAKLRSSACVVSRWRRDSQPDADHLDRREQTILERIHRVAGSESGDVLRGIEGDAARAHFAAMSIVLGRSPLHFTARTRRPPRDEINALLGFCYGLVVTEVGGALEAVGLDPQVGFLHRARSGRPSLALDVTEEFRPITDRFVVTIARRRQMGREHFMRTPGGATYLTDPGRSLLFQLWEEHKQAEYHHGVLDRKVERWALPSVQATLLARHLRGDLPVYPPFLVR